MASPAGFAAGFGCFRDALQILRRHRALWPWCVLPILLNLLVFALAATLFFSHLDGIGGSIDLWLGNPQADAWYEWIWVGPMRALAWGIRWLLIGVFAVIVYISFTLVGGVLASPFLDVLSERVEALIAENPVPAASGVGPMLWSLLQEAKRTFFFIAMQAMFFALGLIPGLQPLVAVAAFVLTVLFFSLDYSGYVFDRRGVSFSERRRWVWFHRRATSGFGMGAFASFLIPGFNFLALPLLVTAGTLLVFRLDQPQTGEGRGEPGRIVG